MPADFARAAVTNPCSWHSFSLATSCIRVTSYPAPGIPPQMYRPTQPPSPGAGFGGIGLGTGTGIFVAVGVSLEESGVGVVIGGMETNVTVGTTAVSVAWTLYTMAASVAKVGCGRRLYALSQHDYRGDHRPRSRFTMVASRTTSPDPISPLPHFVGQEQERPVQLRWHRSTSGKPSQSLQQAFERVLTRWMADPQTA